MLTEFHPGLDEPKNGKFYNLIAVCRVSSPGPGKQDIQVLGDQEASYRRMLNVCIKGDYELTVISGSGSGEDLERPDFLRLFELVGTGQFDMVITEDLGRIARRIQAFLVCEHCEDCETRLYSINDHVDTASENWREATIFAAMHHERSNRDTSDRIKRTHRNRFTQGGCLRHAMFGWVKPAGCKSDSGMSKHPAAEAIYKEWFRRLDEDGATYADIARWLNAQRIPVTPWKTGKGRWDGTMVGRHTFNPLLKGVRERNRRKSKRLNKSGKYRSIKAEPGELLIRKVPHLAFFDELYYDRVIAKLTARNACYRRSDDPATDPCLNRPKKASRYPGRAVFCGICGRPFVWGGHGQTDYMMCKGAKMHVCWNAASFSGPLATKNIVRAVQGEGERILDFDAAFLELLNQEAKVLDAGRERTLHELRRKIASVNSGLENLVRFIREGKESATLSEEIVRLEAEKSRLTAELHYTKNLPTLSVDVPPADEIRRLFREAVTGVPEDSVEFATAMRKLAPRIIVFPFHLCDGNKIVLRAKFKLQIANILSDKGLAETLRRPLERLVTVDLFDLPQREQFRRKIVSLREAGKTERDAAHECGITVTAAQRGWTLQRQMDELHITDPFVPLLNPPDGWGKFKRHLHPDYRFEPLPGAGEL